MFRPQPHSVRTPFINKCPRSGAKKSAAPPLPNHRPPKYRRRPRNERSPVHRRLRPEYPPVWTVAQPPDFAQPPPFRAQSQARLQAPPASSSEEHTSELQSLLRISYAVFCLTKKNKS